MPTPCILDLTMIVAPSTCPTPGKSHLAARPSMQLHAVAVVPANQHAASNQKLEEFGRIGLAYPANVTSALMRILALPLPKLQRTQQT